MILVGVLSRVLCLALFCLAVIACAVCMLFCLDVVEAWEMRSYEKYNRFFHLNLELIMSRFAKKHDNGNYCKTTFKQHKLSQPSKSRAKAENPAQTPTKITAFLT